MKKLPGTKSVIAGSVAVVTFMVFLPSLRNGFINWDDNYYVYNNSFIRNLNIQLLESAFGAFHGANWHPLTWLSHALDYAIWGLNPLGHHLTNNILHALCSLIVVLLVMRLMKLDEKISGNGWPSVAGDRRIAITAAVTGLLFGLHPLHVESVAWVSERKDLLCALFFLLGMTAYAGYADEIGEKPPGDSGSPFLNKNKKYLFSLGWFVLALLSKPMAITLPFVLLLMDWYPFRRMRSFPVFWRMLYEKLPFIVLSLISAMLTMWAQRAAGAMGLMQWVPLPTRVLVAIQSLAAYLGKMLVPLALSPFYPYPENISLFSLQALVPIVLVAGITVACFAVAQRQKLWMAIWGYYVITLIPVLGIIQVGTQAMADRYTYLPSLGPFLIAGLAAAGVYERVIALNQGRMLFKIATLLIALAALAGLSYATIGQIGMWKDSFTLWNYVIEKEPGKVPVAYNNLGYAYLDKGLTDRAIMEFEKALCLNPDYAMVHQNLGNAYAAKGDLDTAITEYQTALRLNPDYLEVHNNLGIAYQSKGLLDMAIMELRTALRLDPDNSQVHNNLGLAYQSKGLLDMAIAEFKTALHLNPYNSSAHLNLGFSYLNKGSIDMARREFEAELSIKPDDYMAQQFLNSITSSKH